MAEILADFGAFWLTIVLAFGLHSENPFMRMVSTRVTMCCMYRAAGFQIDGRSAAANMAIIGTAVAYWSNDVQMIPAGVLNAVVAVVVCGAFNAL